MGQGRSERPQALSYLPSALSLSPATYGAQMRRFLHNFEAIMRAITCQICGGNMGHVPEFSRLRHVLPTIQFSIAEAIFAAGPDGILRKDLAVMIYGLRIGTGKSKLTEISTMISIIRNKIEPYGYFIPRATVTQPLYRMQALEVSE